MLEKEKNQLILEYARLAVEAKKAGVAAPDEVMNKIARSLAMPHREIILAAATMMIR